MFKMKRAAGVFCLGLLLSAALMAADASATRQSPRLSEPTAAALTLKDLSARDPRLQRTLGALKAEAAAKGSVLVAVKLPVAFAPETLLLVGEKLLQHADIEAAVLALRASLPQARSFEAVPGLPYVRLTLDHAGLTRLETIPGLTRITRAESMNWQRDYVRLVEASARAGLGMSPQAPPAPLEEVSQQVFGGERAAPGTHPFQVGLLSRQVNDNREAQFCGGTLVAERLIVTAAHCSEYAPQDVQVLVGARRLDGSGRRINVLRIKIHPNFSRYPTIESDVAVWELESPVVGIPFPTIASTQPTAPGTPLMATGWGYYGLISGDIYGEPDSEFYVAPVDLQQLTVNYLPSESPLCQGTTICTAVVAARGVCFGDSGGPLTIDRGDGYTELVGVASFTTSLDCRVAELNGFANVAHSSIRSFLDSIVPEDSFVPYERFPIERYKVGVGFQAPAFHVTRNKGVINILVTRPSRAGRLTLNVTIALTRYPVTMPRSPLLRAQSHSCLSQAVTPQF